MNRRGFLKGLVVAAVAPAIIRTPGLLMPIKPGLVPKPYVVFGVDLAAPGDSCSMMLRTAGGSFLPVEPEDGSIVTGMCRTILATSNDDLKNAVFLSDRADIDAFHAEAMRDLNVLLSIEHWGIRPTSFRGFPVIERESFYAAMVAEKAARPVVIDWKRSVKQDFDIQASTVNRTSLA